MARRHTDLLGQLKWNPHLHCGCFRGVWLADGHWVPVPTSTPVRGNSVSRESLSTSTTTRPSLGRTHQNSSVPGAEAALVSTMISTSIPPMPKPAKPSADTCFYGELSIKAFMGSGYLWGVAISDSL
jgi:hypothetical protein